MKLNDSDIRKPQTTITFHNLSLPFLSMYSRLYTITCAKGVSFADSVFFGVQGLKIGRPRQLGNADG
mgnify:CR=1 FL=1